MIEGEYYWVEVFARNYDGHGDYTLSVEIPEDLSATNAPINKIN